MNVYRIMLNITFRGFNRFRLHNVYNVKSPKRGYAILVKYVVTQKGDFFMNLEIREAIANDYIDINNLVVEVHNLHVKNRPDVYSEVDFWYTNIP